MKITRDLIRQSRQADLKSYFEQKGYELRREGRKGHYRVVGHQGLIIKDNMFYQFGTGEKGNSVDCLVNVFGMGFNDAVTELTGLPVMQKMVPQVSEISHKPELPKRSENMKRVFAYLCNTRGIPKNLIEPLAKNRLLYQDVRGNCVFVWVEDGEAVGAEIVGTLDSVRFKGVAEKSKYARGFVLQQGVPDRAFFFESAIDLLSFMHLKQGCPDLDNAFFVSMAGLKKAVVEYYSSRYNICPMLCVDNGKEGEAFCKDFVMNGAGIIRPKNKDWNEDLQEKNFRGK